ncbi:sulfatase [Streptococcus moroccensis]|uniref:Arylsulfatase A-like enzyme n=1 Tax=Streptococcus moroccensis TaxID=1451356 RepID=A0ABT9YRH2_9STRE|nr:sulfatase [Streptococcus moroccensis]MDQ0222593.1 arylsulfatase A-like enzyme [Streptococcus moroccensis]
MKIIMVMFDSLNLRTLQPYGCDWTKTANFERLAEKSSQFDNHYVGSMPCMPARRELHTGRYNFLHRSWGPIEPFDDSIFEIMQANGIYTHLITDHQHYWEDGGATYHTRYSSSELFRGQEGDPWKPALNVKPNPSVFKLSNHPLAQKMHAHDTINRQYLDTKEKMPQNQVFDSGLEFIDRYHDIENWFLQIETFDPHEPFYAADEFKDLFNVKDSELESDWPPYYFVTEGEEVVKETNKNYAALLAQCDQNLGRVLDAMDKYNMWEDTLLIVNTDHGYLLGEHGWWGKGSMPMYNEIAHTPLFIYDPVSQNERQHISNLTQSVDIPATILDYFGIEKTSDMQGNSLLNCIRNDEAIREYALYGDHGKQINITNGKHVYMRAPKSNKNGPLYDYTLMPTHMRSRFTVEELKQATLVSKPFKFTKGAPVLKIPAQNNTLLYNSGNLLFDIEIDPGQTTPLSDETIEVEMINAMISEMKKSEAPVEQYERMGLPTEATVNKEWLRESKDKLYLLHQPAVLKDYTWDDAAVRIYNTYECLVPSYKDLELTLAQKLENDQKIVKHELLLKSILELVPEGRRESLHYFLAMAARILGNLS